MNWLTRQGDEVTVGDLVALSVLGADGRDARGRIVGAAGEGAVECVLGDHDDPRGTRPRLRVEEDNLVMLLRRGGDPMVPKVRSDYYAYARPLMRDPETEEQEGEGGGETETPAA